MAGYGAITIERQYASGGSEIGKLIGEKLGIPYHDHEILETAAKNIGIGNGRLCRGDYHKFSAV